MDKPLRVPQVPVEPIAALDEFLEPFRVQFRRRESQEAVEPYLTGRLSEPPNKNGDRLASLMPGPSAQQLQGLRTQIVWDEAALNQQRVAMMCAVRTEGD